MHSRTKRLLALAGIMTASLLMIPATSAAASTVPSVGQQQVVTAALQKGHVNSTGRTRLFATPYGEAYYYYLAPCTNFWYDTIINGRYHSTTHGGYISTDKAGSGWCGD